MLIEQVKKLTPLEQFKYWLTERESIRRKKENGARRPWTDDRILRTYKFCNIKREDDRVTKWIDKHWRWPYRHDPHLWHAMIVARYINWPDTLSAIGYPEPWLRGNDLLADRLTGRRAIVLRTLQQRQREGHKVFTGAYIVSTNGAKAGKVEYVCQLFDRAWLSSMLHNFFAGRSGFTMTLANAHRALMQINGIGSFMAAQIIADLKQTPVLHDASDWYDWAAPGPGSLRGLSRVRGLGTGSRWRTDAFIPELLALRKELKLGGDFDLQNVQNGLCELDKYLRVLHGQGRPRSKYTPTEEA